jgi:mRNA interferase MazF
MTCDAFDVVAVPFPFADSSRSLRRPALVISRRDFNAAGSSVMLLITDARNPPWTLDAPVTHGAVGLKMPSVVRMKFFTLDNRLISRTIGRLPAADQARVLESLRQLLPATPVDEEDLGIPAE